VRTFPANRKVVRAERVQEVWGVECLSGRRGAQYRRAAVGEPPGCLGDERCRDRVDVAPSRRDPALLLAAANDDVNNELLR
jgi:hypothetical protein